MTIGVVKF